MFLKHLLPNMVGPIVVNASFGMAGVIMVESSLSFLGLGVPVNMPSWGAMLDQGTKYLLIAPHLSIYPGLAIMLVVLGFNFTGDGLRDKLAPRNR
jgi:peptide/nickel transport system permease protein